MSILGVKAHQIWVHLFIVKSRLWDFQFHIWNITGLYLNTTRNNTELFVSSFTTNFPWVSCARKVRDSLHCFAVLTILNTSQLLQHLRGNSKFLCLIQYLRGTKQRHEKSAENAVGRDTLRCVLSTEHRESERCRPKGKFNQEQAASGFMRSSRLLFTYWEYWYKC